MNKILIYEYINRLKRDDIVKFCNYKNINLSNNEIDMLYGYIKNDYKRFFNNPEEVLNEIKNKVSNNTYIEIIKLYDQYKNKINF